MNDITLRPAIANDYDTLGHVMFDAIHHGPTKYTGAQSQAWAPKPRAGADWAHRLSQKDVIVAERGSEVLGFMSIEPGGYIDFAYIRPSAHGSGLFRRLFSEVQHRAVAAAAAELSSRGALGILTFRLGFFWVWRSHVLPALISRWSPKITYFF